MNDTFKITDEILSTADKTMENIVKNIIRLNFDEIDKFEFPLDQPFGLQIIHNNTLYCLIVRFSSKNKNLICAGSGFHRRDRILPNGEILQPPFFDRWNWFKYFKESYISYSDPLFFYDDEITLGWFVGTKNEWYLNSLAEIIEKLANNQEIINDNILFFGSSGGGFASVVLATLLKNSKALINNAQLFLLNYNERTLTKLFSLISPDFEGMNWEEIIDEIDYRLDIMKLFEKEKFAPYIIYYLNSESRGDILDHTIPLFRKIRDSETYNGMNIVLYREAKEVPHQPMPTNITVEVIKKYSKELLYNSEESALKTNEYLILSENNYVRELKKERNDLFNSTSWKITKPLRKAKLIIKKIIKR